LQTKPQLGGATPCAADIGMFPFVRQFAAVQPAWFEALPLPAVKAWLAGWLAHPLFVKAMEKQAPVRSGHLTTQTPSAA
jgi:glutathione S-transferase